MKLVTVYPGEPLRRDNFIMGIYNRLAANPPGGYTVLLHTSVEELCEQASAPAEKLEVLEIVAHGNPQFLGVIEQKTLDQFAQALVRASDESQIYLSGCNTGTKSVSADDCEVPHFNIATHLASKVPCRVYGSVGYLNGDTFAEGSVESSIDDWGLSNGITYGNARDAKGSEAFEWLFGKKIERMAALRRPEPAPHTHEVAWPESEIARLSSNLESLTNSAPSALRINPLVAPDFKVDREGKTYSFLYNATIVREDETGILWRLGAS